MKNKTLTITFIACLIFLIITASIGLPIYLRFFYYLHINALDLESKTGLTYAEIKGAYDEVLNYLTLPFTEFSTGVLKYSASGKDHFADCKKLFNLNAIVMIISFIGVITLSILNRKKVFTFSRFKGFHPAFYAGAFAIGIPIILGCLCAIDFDKAFTVFHKIFFPGKDNWVFDSRVDEIIKILPQEFFRNCAIFIGLGLVITCATIITVCAIKRDKK